MSLDDFWKLYDFGGDRSPTPQIALKQFINELVVQIDPANGLDEYILEANLALYLLQQLKDHSQNQKFINVWFCWLSRRFKIVLDRLIELFSSIYNIDENKLFNNYLYQEINPINFFKNFDIIYETIKFYIILNKYSCRKLKYLLFEQARTISGNHTIGSTNLGLAVRSSKKKWLKIAQNTTEKAQYSLLYDTVDECKPVNISCNNWGEDVFKEIRDRYSQLRGNMRELTATNIINILDNIGAKIRKLSQELPPISLDATFESGCLADTLESPLISQMEALIRKEEMVNLSAEINKICTNFKQREQRILYLSFCLKLTQPEVAKELNINQSTVSRAIANFRKKITETMSDREIQLPLDHLMIIFDLIREQLTEINKNLH
jgi:RNA polymerase sigma factor (sigma-70 family)